MMILKWCLGFQCLYELLNKKLKDKDVIFEDLKILLKIPANSRDEYDDAEDIREIALNNEDQITFEIVVFKE